MNKENDYVMPAETIHYGSTSQRPLGTVLAARFGDKGGNANVGVWTDRDRHSIGSELLTPHALHRKGSNERARVNRG